MLKDRRNLMEQEIAKLTTACGQMYMSAMRNPPTEAELVAYTNSVEKLSRMKTELSIVIDMINAGHE
jgi:hypothetical protein